MFASGHARLALELYLSERKSQNKAIVAFSGELEGYGRQVCSRDLIDASTVKATTSYDYLSANGSVDDFISRTSRVKSSSTMIASNDYLGRGAVVGSDVEPLNVMWNKFGTT